MVFKIEQLCHHMNHNVISLSQIDMLTLILNIAFPISNFNHFWGEYLCNIMFGHLKSQRFFYVTFSERRCSDIQLTSKHDILVT